MKNIYAAANLLAVVMLVAASFSAVPVLAFTPPSVFVTLVTLTCLGPFTSATAIVTLTHNGQPIGSVTLHCSPQHHRDVGIIRTELKPNDLHKVITVRIGDDSRTCTGNDLRIPYSAWICHLHRGSALLIVRPTR